MIEAVRCPCGAEPECEVDSAGLGVQAWIVWCEECNKGHQRPAMAARGLTLERAIEIWNDNITRAFQS